MLLKETGVSTFLNEVSNNLKIKVSFIHQDINSLDLLSSDKIGDILCYRSSRLSRRDSRLTRSGLILSSLILQ
jgi:hypothetical protein